MSTLCIVTPWVAHEDLVPDFFGAMLLGKPDQLVIVDNASDPPLEFAAIRNETNRGFAGGCNDGLARSECDVTLFLNNDIYAEMADERWVDKFREAAAPGVLVGAQLRYDQHADVDGISMPYLDGWCFGGTTNDLRALGGFDETYDEPAYYSDNDICLRARARGMRLREVKVGLAHKVSQTAGPHTNPDVLEVVRANHRRYTALARELIGAAA